MIQAFFFLTVGDHYCNVALEGIRVKFNLRGRLSVPE
jgi:hypothetical protein